MPPRFEAAQPLAPSISAAAGGANAILSANDTLARAYQENARLAAARTEAARERSFRAGQAAQDRGLQAQALSAQAMGRLAGVNAEAQQREFQRVADQTNLASQLQNQAERDQFVHRARLAEQRDAIQLRDWLAQRAITHQETARYQQQQQAVAEVLQSQELTPEEKRYALKRLRFGIDEYEQRQKAAQAKMAESHAALYQQQAEMQKRVELQNQEFERRMTEQGQGVLRWTDPNTGKTHPLLKNPRTGEWYNPLLSSGKSTEERPFDTAAASKAADAEAEKQFPPDEWDATKRQFVYSREQAERLREAKADEFRKRQQQHAAAQQPPQQPAGPGQPQQVPAPTPAPPPASPQPPFDRVKPVTAEQKAIMSDYRLLAKRAERLPEKDRKRVLYLIDQAEEIVSTYGHPGQIADPTEADLFRRVMGRIATLMPDDARPSRSPAPPLPAAINRLIAAGSEGAVWEAGSF